MKRVGIIDGTGKGNHRVEDQETYTWISGPRRRLYKLMKKHHKDPVMMKLLIEMASKIDDNPKQGDENESK